MNIAAVYQGIEVVCDRLLRVFLGGQARLELVRIDPVQMAELDILRACGAVRPGPVVPDIVDIAQRVKRMLPAGRCDVEGLARFEVHPGGQDMDVDTAGFLVVPDRAPGITVRFQTRPGQALEVVQHFIDICLAGIILRRPGNQPGRGAVLEGQGVGNLPHQFRIAAQHVNSGAWPALVVGGFLQVCRSLNPGCPAGIELNHHGAGPGSLTPAQCR